MPKFTCTLRFKGEIRPLCDRAAKHNNKYPQTTLYTNRWRTELRRRAQKRLLTMDAETQPLLTSRTQNQIRLRHLWFFLVAGLVVIVLAYCAFVNKIFLLRALECPYNILNKCDTDIENSR